VIVSVARVLRLSLAPTAAADILAGLVLGFGGALPGARIVLLLVGASLSVYHGGMALNDWADREVDRGTRPDRPLPAGDLAPSVVLAGGLVLLAVGIALASLVSFLVGIWVAGVAVSALLYDLAGRGPFSGPLLLGACRAGNLGTGLFAAGHLGLLWIIPLVYGAYVFSISRMGRLEDAVPQEVDLSRARSHLLTAAALLVLAGCLAPLEAWPVGPAAALGLSVAGAVGLFRAAGNREWTSGAVEAAMGLALRRLLIFTAATSCLAGAPHGYWVATGILLGFPISWGLRRVLPPS
jgi:4-hydroxybenzoate polyprenyltransferase